MVDPPPDNTVPPDDTAPPGSGRPWYRHPRRLALLGVLVLGAVGVGVLGWLWVNRGAEEASTDEVIERYRREGDGEGRAAGFLRPAAGVYSYEATGTEELSILGTSQQWGPTMPATVTRDAGDCWTLRIDYSTNHWQEWHYCPSDDVLLDMGGGSYQSFDFGAAQVGDTNVFACDPPGEVIRTAAEPGDSWETSCDGGSEDRGTHVHSAGTNTFVGTEQLSIGGEEVDTFHYRVHRDLSGDQTGTEDTQNWYSVTDGLLVRSIHDIRVASPSPIGDVIYTEKGELRLSSLTPRT